MAMSARVAPEDLEPFRRELTGYCYRMLGSGFEAEDAVQEAMLRAWRHADSFEGRSGLRSWLYRIATNVCIDMQRSVQRRARPMEMGSASPPLESNLGAPLPESVFVTPLPDAAVAPERQDPAAIAEYRESIRLAFVAALQHLPARQRAALILCEVLRWPVADAAELLDTTVAAVNSALQRARATLSTVQPTPAKLDQETTALLERYVDAFERYDMDHLVQLLHQDVVMSMPPFAMWVQGPASVAAFMVEPAPSACRGSRLLATTANGCPAFAQFKPDPKGGYEPWAVQVLEISGGRVAEMHFFLNLLDPDRLFPQFGFPVHLDG
jgi:RNA polymerase sigma-70 factor (ECF subfamily)